MLPPTTKKAMVMVVVFCRSRKTGEKCTPAVVIFPAVRFRLRGFGRTRVRKREKVVVELDCDKGEERAGFRH